MLSPSNLNVPTPSPEKAAEIHAKDAEVSQSMHVTDEIASFEQRQPSVPESASASMSTSDSHCLKDSIVALLTHKEEASARRASNPEIPASKLSRRKRGLLGRAQSGVSNVSSANEAAEPLPVASQLERGRLDFPQPTQSQKIGWNNKVEAESAGIVRDTVTDAGRATRVGRRTRAGGGAS